MQEITKLSEIWKAMPRNNDADIKSADSFYDENIMPISAKRFIDMYGSREEHYDLMFVTVGTSWQPIALSTLVKMPNCLVLIGTADVQRNIEKALAFMKKMGFIPKVVEQIVVDKSESRAMLLKVKELCGKIEAKRKCIDITGGTKAMAAAGAMIAASLDMDIFYVESNYLPVYRHPEPCSERIVKLDRPQDIA